MKLADLAVLADQNIAPELVDALRVRGVDVVSVRERGWEGRSDAFLLGVAHAEARIVLTHDRDFGKLVFATNAAWLGIVYLRPGHLPVERSLHCLEAAYRQLHEVTPPFVIVVNYMPTGPRVRYRHVEP